MYVLAPDDVRRLKRRGSSLVSHVQLVVLVGLVPSLALGQRVPDVVLATTTSVRDAGLLEVLLPPFESTTGYRVRVIAVGSGQAMVLGRRGEADILILHDPQGERAFVEAGFGVERAPLMHNEFVIVGPPTDPARVRGRTAAEAFARVAERKALFVGRGDRSGTDVREQALWNAAGMRPERAWYRESGQGMSASLQIANQLRAYVLTDIGTLLSHRARLDLEILVESDPALQNVYHVVLVNPDRFAWINASGARALRDYLVSSAAQRAIGAFGVAESGRPLFFPDARSP